MAFRVTVLHIHMSCQAQRCGGITFFFLILAELLLAECMFEMPGKKTNYLNSCNSLKYVEFPSRGGGEVRGNQN